MRRVPTRLDENGLDFNHIYFWRVFIEAEKAYLGNRVHGARWNGGWKRNWQPSVKTKCPLLTSFSVIS